ncbi:LysR family transcriptional regulator [Marinobacterium mangrovicola]|uniref:DNA-binding transcriptional LysR family regulator n=1 Tax=Marinobacterium mangrovicola TaxID=1476959 RepID=A0A4R1G6G6_9GAMM|nr:LysR family transcriptional regulator [Marinobacterium mangrovicola]TCK02311.1 DNA-binding transcriptional LysR family regulator [Marinobacterium mangrovicola]
MDRIDAMRAFTTVATEGSFTRAAERLEMSPQLVSKYVSQLEQHLGTRLLNRTTRKVHLTEAGTRYWQGAQQILDEIEAVESQLGDMQESAQGRLRVSAPVSFASHHLAPMLVEFQRQHPAVSIDLQLNDRKVDIVEEGFDIALRIGHLRSSSLIAKRIAPVRLVTVASPEYLAEHGEPARLEDLQGHRYLRYSYVENDAILPMHRWLREKGISLGNEVACNNGDVLVHAAIEGGGIAIQPTFITGPAIAEGKLKVLLEEHEPEPMGLYAVYAHRQLMASKVRSFIDFMDGYFGDPPYWDRF